MTIKTIPGVCYCITCSQACTAVALKADGAELFLASRTEAGQFGFVAVTRETVISDETAEVTRMRGSLVLKEEDDTTQLLALDDLPTAGSQNGVTSNGVYTEAVLHSGAGLHSTQVGENATASGVSSSAFGVASTASGSSALALGAQAQATELGALAHGTAALSTAVGALAMGHNAAAGAQSSSCIGYKALVKDKSTLVLSANESSTNMTQFYLIGRKSPLSTAYCGGEAGLGFIETNNGVVSRCGSIKLSALCTDNTLNSATQFSPTL